MSTIKKPELKYKQVGKTLILVRKENSRSKSVKYTLTVKDKNERDVLVNKIKGYIKKIDASESELVVAKQSKTLVNIFTKGSEVARKKVEIEKVKTRAKSKKIKKENKSTVKAIKKSTTAITKLTNQIANLSEEEKKEILTQLGTSKQLAEKASTTPKTPAVRGEVRRGEY